MSHSHKAKKNSSGDYSYRGWRIIKMESGYWKFFSISEPSVGDISDFGFAGAKNTIDCILDGWN